MDVTLQISPACSGNHVLLRVTRVSDSSIREFIIIRSDLVRDPEPDDIPTGHQFLERVLTKIRGIVRESGWSSFAQVRTGLNGMTVKL